MAEAVLCSAAEAAELIAAGARAVDCRFELGAPDAGQHAYLDGHLPGAVYAHLDRHLSDMRRSGCGRHPLPHAADFSRHLSRWGIGPDTVVIAYDGGSAVFAGRLWWLLQVAGHTKVRVLDGGLAAWQASGLGLSHAPSLPPPLRREVRFDTARRVDAAEVAVLAQDPATRLVDARPGPRFRGEVEPLDPVAGHIPGALSRPLTENLTSDGRFKPAATLRAEFETLLDGRPASALIAMCGSGVTACHHLLALAHAGMTGARLYPGSWSEWVSDPTRPVASGS